MLRTQILQKGGNFLKNSNAFFCEFNCLASMYERLLTCWFFYDSQETFVRNIGIENSGKRTLLFYIIFDSSTKISI